MIGLGFGLVLVARGGREPTVVAAAAICDAIDAEAWDELEPQY